MKVRYFEVIGKKLTLKNCVADPGDVFPETLFTGTEDDLAVTVKEGRVREHTVEPEKKAVKGGK